MPDAPKILIAGTPGRTEYYEPYLHAIRGPGRDPFLDLPSAAMCASDDAVREFLRPYRGILFPGGVDIEPRRYGQPRHPEVKNVDSELDEAQLALAGAALADDIPILGICRGLQILAVAAGAGLYQDLPSERPSAIEHRDQKTKTRLIHSVSVDPDSRLAALSGELRFKVNSRHHQAAREDPDTGRIGPFRIVARAPDGVIEGLEDPDRPFRIAVQWHPENLVVSPRPNHAPSRNLFRAFVAACILPR
jgi:putative glutamine amidotransferase